MKHVQKVLVCGISQTLAPEFLKPCDILPLKQVRRCISKSTSYQNPTVKEKFCWDVIQYICEAIPPSPFDIRPYSVVECIGHLYVHYCTETADHSRDPMKHIGTNWPTNVATYFKWVASIYDFLRGWKDKFGHLQVTVKEIHSYGNHFQYLSSVAKCVGATALVVEEDQLKTLKTKLRTFKDNLTGFLLFSVKSSPKLW